MSFTEKHDRSLSGLGTDTTCLFEDCYFSEIS